MKVKHHIVPDEEEVKALYDIVAVPALLTYGSTSMQETAMTSAKEQFSASLTDMLSKAFKIGCKIGKAKADVKDTSMYQDNVATPT